MNYFAIVLGWLFPGAGHWYLGERKRGVVICIAIMAAFILGIMLGGVRMVRPQTSTLWFLAQSFAGLPTGLVYLLQNAQQPSGVGRGLEWGQVYTGVAGLLNFLAVLDVIMRSQGIPRSKTTEHI